MADMPPGAAQWIWTGEQWSWTCPSSRWAEPTDAWPASQQASSFSDGAHDVWAASETATCSSMERIKELEQWAVHQEGVVAGLKNEITLLRLQLGEVIQAVAAMPSGALGVPQMVLSSGLWRFGRAPDVVEALDDMGRHGSFASFHPIMIDILHWVRINMPDGLPPTEHWDLIGVNWEWCEEANCYTVDKLEYSVQFGSYVPAERFWHVRGRSFPPR